MSPLVTCDGIVPPAACRQKWLNAVQGDKSSVFLTSQPPEILDKFATSCFFLSMGRRPETCLCCKCWNSALDM